MQKRAMLGGSLLRPLPLARKQAVARALLTQVWPHLGTRYRPPLGREFALRDAAGAHAYAESGAGIGKIILRCDQP
jgi:NADPH:quinone reductase-like Zn-dependent oxidoreductase